MKVKKSKYKYNFGSFVKENQSGIAAGGNMLASGLDLFKESGSANVGISTAQGALSGAAAGAALGPLGMAGGALLGGVTSFIGSNKQKKALEKQYQKNVSGTIDNTFNSMTTANVNPYGTETYALGGTITDPTDPIKKVRLKGVTITSPKITTNEHLVAHAKKYDNGVMIVEKKNSPTGEGEWGYDNTGAWYNPKSQVKLPPLGLIDHRGVQSGQYYQGSEATRDAIFLKEKALKAASSGRRYADGGDTQENIINIEKGELQIDPSTGKILREYNGINPETSGMYKSHSKGKDPKDNFVTATPGTFIITSAKAKKYKDAVDNNDKLAQQTILQNIRNYKSTVDKKGNLKFDTGGGIPYKNAINPLTPYVPNQLMIGSNPYMNLSGQSMGVTQSQGFSKPVYDPNSISSPQYVNMDNVQATKGNLSKGLDFLGNYGASLYNIGRGIAGNVETQSYGKEIKNPYLNQIESNLPQDINMQPIYNDIYSQSRLANNDIRNNINSSAVYRANRQNLAANTQKQLSNARLQGQQINNQVRGQRASIYGNLGAESMREQQRLQGYNLNVDQINAANRGAKSDLLTTGLSQLQQIYQNNKMNKSLSENDAYKLKLLKEMFPNLKHYKDLYK